MEKTLHRKFSYSDILRIIIPPFLTLFLFILSYFFYFLPQFEKLIIQEKRESVREAVQLAWKVLDYWEREEREGRLSRAEAQAKALQMIEQLRYGVDERNYFWISELSTAHPIMHPFRKDLIGKNVNKATDSYSIFMTQEFRRIIRESGEGFVDYLWQYKDNPNVIQPKISFIRGFQPWDWFIGSGIYMKEVQDQIGDVKRNLLLTTWIVAFIISGLSYWIVRERIRSEKKREQAESQRQQEKKRLFDILEFLPDATLVINREGKVIAWNRAIEKMTGISKEEMLGKGDYEYAKPFYGYARPLLIDYVINRNEEIIGNYQFFYEKNGICQAEAVGPYHDSGKGIQAMITASPLMDETGEIVGAIESIRDITEHKKSEEARRISEANYRAIFDSTNEAIFVHDPQSGAILDNNQKACDMYGCTSEEFRTISLSAFVQGEHPYTADAALEFIHKAAQGNKQRFEWQAKDKNGHRFWVEISLSQVVLEGQERILAVIRDIDSQKKAEEEKRRLEEQLQQSQKMEAVGKLAGGVAHDFNNLLTVIQGYSDLALANTDPGNLTYRQLEEVKKAASRAESITRQLLAFSRRQIIQPQNLDLNTVIRNLEKMLCRLIGEDIEMRTALKPDLGAIRGDPHQIEQVIINLAVNARDAMPRGGKLTLETDTVYLDQRYASQHVDVWPGSYIMLAVSDNGCGMTKEIQSRIFEPFFTTKGIGEGTGLGLSMVYGIIKQNGGNITVYSEPGKGTVFKIYFPLIHADSVVILNDNERKSISRGTETILLVEDELAVLILIQNILTDLGYQVLSANSAEEAIKLFNEQPESIDLLLTDVVMPHLGGRDLTTRLTGLRPELKILYMSGYTDDAIVHHGMLESGIQFIQKPFLPNALAQKIRSVLDL